MQALRNAHHLLRLVLAWFVLSIGVAGASPVVHPTGMDLVCSSGGDMRWVALGDDDGQSNASGHTLDCPLCAGLSAPPVQASRTQPAPSSLAHALAPVMAARIAAATAPPLPSRGPPSSLL